MRKFGEEFSKKWTEHIWVSITHPEVLGEYTHTQRDDSIIPNRSAGLFKVKIGLDLIWVKSKLRIEMKIRVNTRPISRLASSLSPEFIVTSQLFENWPSVRVATMSPWSRVSGFLLSSPLNLFSVTTNSRKEILRTQGKQVGKRVA